ncbi:D-alanyl-D-alanine carboxypeptidase/D-alanyl-D-alanine-endopeptidase [Zoogloea sp.]|uniref:D-alanyl-D-alanine carboxypeptidase/D-alanyl-D-alanine endopeptidase n=1 Tax=Zoogloea sp. TaxID=49181 RepID=UPI001415B6EB|nr:MAG: D-alanyl-D-alanine carboxypeptidase/D-alanyl-D-alanine-endopeptidase [Zoogloea sp.]
MPPPFSAPPSIHLAALLSLVALAPAAPAAPAWPPALESSLARTAIPRAATAVLVQDVDSTTPLLAHRTGEAMNPASVMKLVTSYAALDQLGPTYTWKTRIVAEAPIRNGVLKGDLHVIGGGDPRLSRERLWLLLRELRSRDIRRIEGNVVTDRRFFQLAPHDPGAFDQRPLRPYNAPADALNIDYGALPLRLAPSATGADVSIDPLPAGLSLDNRIRRAGTGPCNDPPALLAADSRSDANGNSVLVLEGSLPPACTSTFDWNLAPLTPARLFEGQFRTLWRELGGEIDGRFVDGPAPAGARPLAESTSPTLPEVLRDMNKWSNNVIARHLLATLGAESEPGRDSAAAGSRVVERSLAAAGIPTDKLVIENGAGLSRNERASADTLGRLLMAAWRSRSMPELIASLPIAGRDGTARRRVANSPAAGAAHIKTGTLDGVRSLAGYVQGASGHRYIVVLLINHPNAGAGREVQDALLEWVASL